MDKKKTEEVTEKTKLTTPPPGDAADAWKAVETEASTLSEQSLEPLHVDLQAAGETATAVVGDVRGDAALSTRFTRVIEIGELPKGALGRVVLLANAAWYVRHEQSLAESTHTRAQAPADLVERATELRVRMRKVGVYYLEKHVTDGPVVEAVGRKKGHRALANDLVTMADLYKRHHAVISKDTQNFRETDEADARALAADVRKALTTRGTPELALWTDRCVRVYTLLRKAYAAVQSTGRWLLRDTPEEAERRFPSLVAGSRSEPKARKKAAPVTPVDTPVTPSSAKVSRRARRRPR